MTTPWYQNAFFYSVDVEKYADSDGDGVGDFRGLIDRLDHIVDLGVTCVWLLPFYRSPRRDNGYDVEDYFSVDPRFGTLDDFASFVREAGQRGVRVLVDLVMAHTSDQHPWFHASRRDPASRFRGYYQWSSEPRPVPPGREIAFPGEEVSAWTFDDNAQAYYYHPFYTFQPDLDMNRPEVQEEALRVMDFWLSLGVAGFRMDAVPLMLGLEGPLDEPVDDPHGLLRRFRSYAESRRHDAVLLGEVDVHRSRLAEYFGDGDELQLLLDFLLNNYLFEALATERREPLVRALDHLPEPPHPAQWVNFLRNHDELNLCWLSDADRDLVYERFAPDPGMRIYGRGIRRRIAPMLGGDQRRMELAFSLLFSLPGAPLVYYGDEIGMGENLSLHGRDPVRIPMQWNGGHNGGFSSAPRDRCVVAPVMDGGLGYSTVNVEEQAERQDSLLAAVRRFARAWHQTPALALGTARVLPCEGDEVLAHATMWRDEVAVVANNLGSAPATISVDLREHGPGRLEPLLGECRHHPGEEPGTYVLELGPYGYAWCCLDRGPKMEEWQ